MAGNETIVWMQAKHRYFPPRSNIYDEGDHLIPSFEALPTARGDLQTAVVTRDQIHIRPSQF